MEIIMAKAKQAEFTKWFGPVLDVLRELGGSGRPKEVIEKIAKNENIPEKTREETLKNGQFKFDNQVAWARQYLVWDGLIDNSKKGVWSLTSEGFKTKLTQEEGHAIFLKRVAIYQNSKKEKNENQNQETIEEIEENPEIVEQTTLLDVLKSVSPTGFEHLCKRLLREHGFEDVEVTQRSRDEGIDGYGTLKINPLLSIKVVFQCKRYKKTVSRSFIGDFRNAVMGRAEKGMIITTGTFSGDAKHEATREGVIPIELIDGEKLVELFEQVELGVKAKTAYEIDYKFFEEFYEIE
jgi:restriction system protein